MALSVLLAVFTAYLAVSSGTACEVTMANIQEKMTEYMMECVAHKPKLMIQIMEHMNNPDSLAQMNFVCSNQADLVDVGLCVKDRMIDCVPEADARSFLNQILNRKRVMAAVQFICDHREQLMDQNQCFGPTAQQQFVSCYVGQVQELATTFMSNTQRDVNYQDIVCKVIGTEEACIRQFHGTCDKSYVKLIIQVLEIFFPMDSCPKVDYKDMARNKLLSSILVNGRPQGGDNTLRFGPTYKVIAGNGK